MTELCLELSLHAGLVAQAPIMPTAMEKKDLETSASLQCVDCISLVVVAGPGMKINMRLVSVYLIDLTKPHIDTASRGQNCQELAKSLTAIDQHMSLTCMT